MSVQEQPLAYFQPSPVRGQLEPWDPKTRPNWRYLQCTDTPNELKVLLPPRTAQVYAYLLSQEKHELVLGAEASWDKLLHLRHLKERLLRKCHRLSRLSTVRPTTDVAFRTIHAPADFQLKELEKWYRHRDDPDNVPASFRRHTGAAPKPSSAARKSGATKHSHGTRALGHSRSHRHTHATTTDRRYSDSNFTHSSEGGSEKGYTEEVYEDDKTLPSVPPDDDSFIHVGMPAPETHAYHEHDLDRPNITSPDPLPHPYRPRDSTLGELHDQLNSQFPEPQFEMPAPEIPEPTFPMPSTGPPEAGPPEGGPLERPTLHRRRSSLKRSNSRLSFKSVAWAMDVDEQRARYNTAVGEIEVAGDDLDVARTAHREEIMLLQDLHRSVAEIKDRLRLDEERIKMEREKLVEAEEAVRRQEERLALTFEQLEIQESRYQVKVTTALDEASKTLISSTRHNETIYEEN